MEWYRIMGWNNNNRKMVEFVGYECNVLLLIIYTDQLNSKYIQLDLCYVGNVCVW